MNVTFRWIRNHVTSVSSGVPESCVACPHALRVHPFLANAGSFWSGLFLAALVLVLLGGALLLVVELLFAGTGWRVRFWFLGAFFECGSGADRAHVVLGGAPEGSVLAGWVIALGMVA